MKRKTSFLPLFLWVIAFVLASPNAWGQSEKKLDRMRVAVPSTSTTYFPFIAARDRGIYKRHGIDFELILMRPPIMTQALVAGEIDVSTVWTRDITASLSGFPIRIVMALNTGPSHHLVVKPEIKSPKDLKGKTIGIDGPSQLLEVLLAKALEKHGFMAGRDVKTLSMGGAGSDTRLTALLSGQMDGTLLGNPHSSAAARQGYNILLAMKDTSKMASAGLAMTTQKIQGQPDAVTRLIAGTIEGINYLAKNKGEFTKMLATHAGIKDADTANAVFDEYLSLASFDGLVSDESMIESINFVKGLQRMKRDVAISEVADWSLAKKAAVLAKRN
jgi:NitT/TauT family transport system substrate-binding protein